MFHLLQYLIRILIVLSWLHLPLLSQAEPPTSSHTWQNAIRTSPYWISQGSYDNLLTLRSWVLMGSAYCKEPRRHILFDRQARFLGYFSNLPTSAKTQSLLNTQRQRLAAEQRVTFWAPGTASSPGYPFALSCDQPHANLPTALSRYLGEHSHSRLWGTWDGMTIGTPQKTVSLHQALLQVYDNRRQLNRISMPREVISTLAGKILIESGGRPRAHSAADAKGIMQLSPQALEDCGLEKRFHFHRMAQIDCALKLLEQNHRILQPAFTEVFAQLPQAKANDLYASLLLQAYHGGIGRVTELLQEPELSRPAKYFAQHHKQYSAGDIALGMVFHNLGRRELGFASLYYVVDVGIAKHYACRSIKHLPGC